MGVSQFDTKMDLASNFNKATRGVKVFADLVAGHGFDHRISDTFATQIIQRMLNEPAAQTLASGLGRNSEVGNAGLARIPVQVGGDVTNDLAIGLGHKCAGGIQSDIVVDVPRLSPAPIVAMEYAKPGFHELIERHAVE